MSTITGDKHLDAALMHMADKSADKALVAGVRASLSPLTQALRAAVNVAGVSPQMKRAARQAINKRFGKIKRGVDKGGITAKAGFGVGKQSKAKKAKAAKRATDKQRGGVGISSANIHWPVLGTAKRTTGKGKSTGAMPSLLGGVTDKAFAASKDAMLAAAKQKIADTIAKEAARLRK